MQYTVCLYIKCLSIYLYIIKKSAIIPNLSSSFEEYPLQVRHKQDWDRGFILLLPQAAALPE